MYLHDEHAALDAAAALALLVVGGRADHQVVGAVAVQVIQPSGKFF